LGNGDIALTGYGYAEDTVPEAEGMLLFRLKPNGQILWGRVYKQFRGFVGLSVCETPDGGFLVVGFPQYSPNYGYDKANLILRTDVAGNPLWSKVYPTSVSAIHWPLPTQNGFAGVVVDSGYSYGNAYIERFDTAGILLNKTRVASGVTGAQMTVTSDGGYIVATKGGTPVGTTICRVASDMSTKWTAVLPGYQLDWNIYQTGEFIRSLSLLCANDRAVCLFPFNYNLRMVRELDAGATDSFTVSWAKCCSRYGISGVCSPMGGGFLFSPAGRDVLCCDGSGNPKWQLRNVLGSYEDSTQCYGQVAFIDSLGRGFFIAADNLYNKGNLLYKFGPHYPPAITYPPHNFADTAIEDSTYSLTLQVSDSFPGDVVHLEVGDTLHRGAWISGMTFYWKPDEPYRIEDTLVLFAYDRLRQKDSIQIRVHIVPVNDPPRFAVRSVNKVVTVNRIFYDTLPVSDQDDSILAFTFLSAPQGISVTNKGVLVWTPEDKDIGGHDFRIIASDGSLNDTLHYKLQVVRDTVYAIGQEAVLHCVSAKDTARKVIYSDGTAFKMDCGATCSDSIQLWCKNPDSTQPRVGYTYFEISHPGAPELPCILTIINPNISSFSHLYFYSMGTTSSVLTYYDSVSHSLEFSPVRIGSYQLSSPAFADVKRDIGRALFGHDGVDDMQDALIYDTKGRIVARLHGTKLSSAIAETLRRQHFSRGVYIAQISARGAFQSLKVCTVGR
jgi:hypothetical protein